MLDRNYLKVPYHKDAILGGGWFVLNKQQQIQLTSKIDQAIKKAELIDKTHMSEKLRAIIPNCESDTKDALNYMISTMAI